MCQLMQFLQIWALWAFLKGWSVIVVVIFIFRFFSLPFPGCIWAANRCCFTRSLASCRLISSSWYSSASLRFSASILFLTSPHFSFLQAFALFFSSCDNSALYSSKKGFISVVKSSSVSKLWTYSPFNLCMNVGFWTRRSIPFSSNFFAFCFSATTVFSMSKSSKAAPHLFILLHDLLFFNLDFVVCCEIVWRCDTYWLVVVVVIKTPPEK